MTQPGNLAPDDEEFETDMAALAEEDLPSLPKDFSRKDIYVEID